MNWLVVSIVLSVVLTVVLNLVVRLFPDASERAARRLDDLAAPDVDSGAGFRSRTRVYVPWKAMIVISLLATVVLNLLFWSR